MTISQKYDELYNRASAVIKKHNPCQVRKEKDKSITCLGSRIYSGYGQHDGFNGEKNLLCCGGCKYHDACSGCTVKALTCKTWLCATARQNSPECATELDAIRQSIVALDLYAARGSKKDSLREYKNRGNPVLKALYATLANE